MLSLPCTVYDRIPLCLFLVFLTLFWAFLSFQIHPSSHSLSVDRRKFRSSSFSIFRRSICNAWLPDFAFPESSLRFWGNSRCKFSLLSIVLGKKSSHFLICEFQLLSNLTQSHSLAAKLYYFLLVFLNVAVFSGHSKDLLWYFYSTTGGLLFSLSTFAGAVQVHLGESPFGLPWKLAADQSSSSAPVYSW